MTNNQCQNGNDNNVILNELQQKYKKWQKVVNKY